MRMKKVLDLIENINYIKNMAEKKNISQEFRLKNIFETRNYFTEEVEKNELMSQKHKKVCTILNYIENRE